MSDQKGNKPLKKFDAQNIAGRAGRFMHHYKGFVFSIDNNFERILGSNSEELKNLEYDNFSIPPLTIQPIAENARMSPSASFTYTGIAIQDPCGIL